MRRERCSLGAEMNHMPRNTTEWGVDAVDAFASMWRDGLPVKEIADRLSVTVSAVNKKRWRLGLEPRSINIGSKNRWAKEKASKPQSFTITPRAPTPYKAKQLNHPLGMVPVALLERTGCAFAVDRIDGVWLFCDCTTEAVSDYCSTHKSQMYQPSYRR